MQVFRFAFEELLCVAEYRVRRWNVPDSDLQKLVGLAVRLRLSNPEMSRDEFRQQLNEQRRRCRLFPGVGNLILQAIVSRIVSLVIEWMLDELQKESLLKLTGEAYELPEVVT